MKLASCLTACVALASLAALAPSTAFADCSPACTGGKICRYDSTRSPQFYCAAPKATYGKNPTAPRATQGSGGALKGSPSTGGGSMARSAAPKSKPANNKDGKRPNKP